MYVSPRVSSQPRVSWTSGVPASTASSLALDLEGDGPLHGAERVHVLDLDARAQHVTAARPDRDVGLDAHLALFHGRVGRADGQQQQAQLFGVAARGLRRMDDRVSDDLHQRHAAAVEVDERQPAATGRVLVQQPGRVLLQMRARDADLDRSLGSLHGQRSVRRERQVVLRDLIALGQVRVEVVLAIPARDVRDRPRRWQCRWR